MIYHATEQEEKAHLKSIQALIQAKEQTLTEAVNRSANDIKELKKYFWDNRADMDSAEKNFTRTQITNDTTTTEHAKKMAQKLEKTKKSPYFARVDFKKTSEVRPVYIGIHGLHDDHDIVIHDWRAPVSSVFYDYEQGPARYHSPDGPQEGEVTLKRQYKIEDGELSYMLESHISIDDDILQKELSSTSDEKMKNIVATIQKEQNEIIRNEEAKTLIIQGAAGSGKTSIALHRIAFMMYRYKNIIQSADMLILSPNKVFGDYISNVLPELGEDNVPEMTFEKLASKIAGASFRHQSFAEQVAYLLDTNDAALKKRIAYKSSVEFLEALTHHLETLEATYFTAHPIVIGALTIPQAEVEMRMTGIRTGPLKKKMDKLAKDLALTAKIRCEATGEKWEKSYSAHIKKEVANMLPFKKSVDVYQQFFADQDQPEMFQTLRRNVYEFSDVFPLIYTMLHFDKTSSDYGDVKHLLVDEMQDYTPVQYAVVKKLFNCKMTILGDAYQAVNPYSSSSLEKIQAVFPNSQRVTLRKSYRSTVEIAEFAQSISPNPEIIPIQRHGEQPSLIECVTTDEQTAELRLILKGLPSSDFTNLGIICRTEKMARTVYESIKDLPDTQLLDFKSETFTDGIIVTSAHMSKGLEFDQVVIPYASAHEYQTEMDRKMLYVACTRAMHKLDLLSVGESCSWLPIQHT